MTSTLIQLRRAPFFAFFCGLLFLSLAACGGSSSSSEPVTDDTDTEEPDTTAPTASVKPETDLAIRDAVVIAFDEAIDPESLELGGTLAAFSDEGEWNDAHTELTVSPSAGAWESGVQNLTVDAADIAGNAMETLDTSFEIRLVFENFQTASVVIGQPDFKGMAVNQGTTPAANTLNQPWGVPTIVEGNLWIPDNGNSRLLGFKGIPEANNASASWVVGQADFVTKTFGIGASQLKGPQQGIAHDGHFYVLDWGNNRIAIFDTVPTSPPGTATHVIGQPDLISNTPACSATGFSGLESMTIADGKLIVADMRNSRVLIWNEVPADANAVPADIVLGQGSMTSCFPNDDDQDGTSDAAPTARTLNWPSAVWSDGNRLVVVDASNNRVLIWNSFPESDFAPADVVLGQGDFSHGTRNDDDQDGAADAAPTARTLTFPYDGVWSNGLQLFISDTNNNRVLVWDSFPTENFATADVVLGQSDFVHAAPNDDDQDGGPDGQPSARTLNLSLGGFLYRDKLLVLDFNNNRALVFESK